MSQVDMLSSEEQSILLWIAESEAGLIESNDPILVDRPAFDWVSTVIDQLVRRRLLGRDFIKSVGNGSGPHGLSAYLTDQGAQVVAELWRRRHPLMAPETLSWR
jgi:hypothetical protein